ncbi:MAG TPA: helicase-related protein, partial [Candidatus Polarisedimenticolia bacterium]|nr:helicase-related protein [Candidatus Polarisedimenticolia bacterium]
SVSHVVNFDMPTTPDAYTHRIGRTGRSQREGKAYTFVTGEDHALVRAVEDRIGSRITRKNADALTREPAPRRSQTPSRSSRRGRRRPKGDRSFNPPAERLARDPGVVAGPVLYGVSPCGNS